MGERDRPPATEGAQNRTWSPTLGMPVCGGLMGTHKGYPLHGATGRSAHIGQVRAVRNVPPTMAPPLRHPEDFSTHNGHENPEGAMGLATAAATGRATAAAMPQGGQNPLSAEQDSREFSGP